MCEQIARRLGLDEERCRLLRDASPLHDIGKIAIPDEILLKRGAFTDQERRTMQRHAEIGHRLLSGSASEVLDLAATIALVHHERWDGNGYPYGLAGEAIPLEGRIASVADVFDALTTERVYRRGAAGGGGTRDDAGAAWRPVRPAGLRRPRGHRPRDASESHAEGDTAGDDDARGGRRAGPCRPDRSAASTESSGKPARAKISERQLRRACRAAERGFRRTGAGAA